MPTNTFGLATSTNTYQDQTPLGFEYTTTTISPGTICIVPILRSGLGMVEGMRTRYLFPR